MRSFDHHAHRSPGRLLVAAFLALAFVFVSTSSAMAAGSVTIYKNSLKSSDGRDEIHQLGKGSCNRGGSDSAFRTKVGKKTKECFYGTSVAGRDLDVSVSARLFKSTPKKVRAQAYVAVSLRQASDGSRYQLSVYPSGKRFHVKKILDDGRIKVLEHGTLNKIKGFDEANKLTLRAYNDLPGQPEGSARILAVINGKKAAVLDDARGNLLEGQDSSFSIGSKRNATGAIGSFTSLAVRMPDPF